VNQEAALSELRSSLEGIREIEENKAV